MILVFSNKHTHYLYKSVGIESNYNKACIDNCRNAIVVAVVSN